MVCIQLLPPWEVRLGGGRHIKGTFSTSSVSGHMQSKPSRCPSRTARQTGHSPDDSHVAVQLCLHGATCNCVWALRAGWSGT